MCVARDLSRDFPLPERVVCILEKMRAALIMNYIVSANDLFLFDLIKINGETKGVLKLRLKTK